MEPVVAIIVVVSGICILLLTPSYLKSRERMRLIELVRASSDKGHPIPPEVLSTLTAEPKPQRPSHIRDFRRGVVLLSAALAVEVIALCVYAATTIAEQDNDPGDIGEAAAVGIGIAGFGAIPACIGLAFLLLGMIAKKSEAA